MTKQAKLAIAALAALTAVLAFAVISQASNTGRVTSQPGTAAGPMLGAHRTGMGAGAGAGASTAGSVRLPTAEAAGLQYMVEEEKLAHDVYAVLADKYPDAPFATIAQSEQRHQAAVQRQLARADVSDPTAGRAAGVFANTELQRLYDTLVKRGSTSRAAALEVGALIERTDIADLGTRADATTDTAIRRVYGHLEQASGQHLRIFEAQIAATAA